MTGANSDDFPLGRTDILMAASGRDTDVNLVGQHPPVAEYVPLDRGVLAGRLGGTLAARIFDACELHGEYPTRSRALLGHRQSYELFSFVRHPAPLIPGVPEDEWDPDHVLWEITILSRLIRSNPIDTVYAARVIRTADATRIVPLPEYSENRYHAFVFDSSKQFWLSDTDTRSLGYLLRQYRLRSQLPERISEASWWLESGARTRILNIRWPMIGFAVEALLNTREGKVTGQIKRRLPRLARHLGISGLSGKRAGEFYRRRSEIAHGHRAAFMRDNPNAALLDRVESVVRAAVRAAICDEQFRRIFVDDYEIRRMWDR